MKHLNRILFSCAALLLVSCDDQIIDVNGQDESKHLTFSVSMKDQDWYGFGIETRGIRQKVDDVIPTDMETENGRRVFIMGHEMNGIDSKPIKMGSSDETRAYVSQSIDTRKLSVSQVGFTQGNNTNTYVELLNTPAVTTNGVEWSCNEFFVNRTDFTAVRTFGALFPYSENYVVKTDDYEGEEAMTGSLRWLYRFRVEYELVSDSAQQQEDLLYAKQIRSFTAEQYATDGPTPLEFRHAMTAVKVKLGSKGFVPCTIKEVRLKNIYNKGTFHFFDRYKSQSQSDMLNTNGWWEVDTTSMTDCYSITDFDTQGEYNCYVTGDAATFMMIPQQLPESATLEMDVVFPNDLDENFEPRVRTITSPIGRTGKDHLPKLWNIGTTYEYIIDTQENVDGYYMVIDGIDHNERARFVDAAGGNASLTMKSYKRVDTAGGTSEYAPLKWQYIGWSLDGENWTDEDTEWLHMSLADGTKLESYTMGNGSATGEVINIVIDKMPASSGVSHADILKSRPAKGSVTDGAYDLSRHAWGTGESIGTTTANSYVIDAPGHYTFPTVYGNSMKDGQANPMAYGQAGTIAAGGVPNASSFVDYLERPIVSPLIQYNTTLSCAKLLWEDVDGLVSDVRLTQHGDYVEFRIDRENIDQGNAVIAVYDIHDRLVWSWHIWVTDEDINATVPTGSGKFQAMPVNLGWKSVSTANAVPGRDIYLLFAQGEDEDDMVNYQTVVRITQRSAYVEDEMKNHKGSSPYYQWGRKDPMVGAYNGKSIPVYTFEGRSFYTESFTTWAVPEWLDIVNKTILFGGALITGVALTVCTCGVGVVIAGGVVATAVGAGAYVGTTALDEKCFTTTDKWGTTIGYAIQHPTCDIKSAMTWTDCKEHAPYHDLWGIGQDTDNKNKKVVKTIYDPCPVGFHVPEGNAFSAISNFNVNDGLSGKDIYLPACGARMDYIHAQSMEGSFDIPLIDVGSSCGYWTAAPSNEKENKNQHDNESYRSSEGAFALVAGKDKDGDITTGIRGSYEAWGYNIRPIADF